MEQPKIVMVCSYCGSPNVVTDAYASWNTDTQSWELETTFDDGFCYNCEGPATLDAKPYTPIK